MTTTVKGAESQMISISAMSLYPASIVPFQTQCEPFRCRRPRAIHSRAPGAQRVSAPPRHLAARRTAGPGRGRAAAPPRVSVLPASPPSAPGSVRNQLCKKKKKRKSFKKHGKRKEQQRTSAHYPHPSPAPRLGARWGFQPPSRPVHSAGGQNASLVYPLECQVFKNS